MAGSYTDEELARRIWENVKAEAKGIAGIQGPAPRTKTLRPDEEVLLWNTVAKGWTPEQEMALLASGKSPEEVGRQKYPHREKLMARGDRALSKLEQYRYAERMAKRADPTWQRPPRPDAAPAPIAGMDGGDAAAPEQEMAAPSYQPPEGLTDGTIA